MGNPSFNYHSFRLLSEFPEEEQHRFPFPPNRLSLDSNGSKEYRCVYTANDVSFYAVLYGIFPKIAPHFLDRLDTIFLRARLERIRNRFYSDRIRASSFQNP